MIFLCGLLRNHHGGHLAVAVDIHDELPGAFAHAGTAGSTLLVVDNGHIVHHGNGAGEVATNLIIQNASYGKSPFFVKFLLPLMLIV